MTKKDKNSLYTHLELGIYKGISFKLVIPSKKNKEKYPNYYIQYDGSKKHYIGVKSIYLSFTSLEIPLQTTEQLIELYLSLINDIIIPTLREKVVIEHRVRFNDLVADVVNRFFNIQLRQFESGELVDISDYRDRNKKLNDYFKTYLDNQLRLNNLNKETWTEFRYFLLKNYKIKSNSTVNQYITYVKSLYNWLQIDQELLIANHVLKLKRLDTSKQIAKYEFVEHSRVNEFLDLLSNDEKWLRLNIISLLVYENAKRPVQAYRLQAKDIDLKRKTLYLLPKSRSKTREVTLISDELCGLINKVYENTIKKGQAINPNDYLLGGHNCFKIGGKEIRQGDIRDLQIVPFREQYPQFKDILIYSLKHTTITSVAQHNLGLAQRMANHSNQSTTEIYDRNKKSSKAIPRKKLAEDFNLI